jgi:hypothetical protein
MGWGALETLDAARVRVAVKEPAANFGGFYGPFEWRQDVRSVVRA